uniref:Putative glycoside hydrolase, family 19 n=1 Tax=Myxococcus fulvus TaxID=33 RepID=B0YR17_MYXFU|nr:putative glycoside hydrolase, family 19 [Myxococcus fulvus]
MSFLLIAGGLAAASVAGAVAVKRRGARGILSLEEMRAVAPNLPENLRVAYLPFLNEALDRFDIRSYARVTAHLGQILHECNQFRSLVELSDAKAYEGRSTLGNTKPGDGELFKGRGAIQLTGRHNYERAEAFFGVPFTTQPELVATPTWAFLTGGWFWRHGSSSDLNKLADAGDFLTITKRINGGTNGLAHRESYYAKAQAALASWKQVTT